MPRAMLASILAFSIVGSSFDGRLQGQTPPARPEKEDDAVAKEKHKLQGSWVLVQIGAGVPNPDKGVLTLSFEKDRFETYMVVKDGEKAVKKKDSEQKGTYLLDISKSPRWIDLKQDGKFTTKSIYECDGDRLKIAYGTVIKRPKSFPKSGMGETLVYVYERVKK